MTATPTRLRLSTAASGAARPPLRGVAARQAAEAGRGGVGAAVAERAAAAGEWADVLVRALRELGRQVRIRQRAESA